MNKHDQFLVRKATAKARLQTLINKGENLHTLGDIAERIGLHRNALSQQRWSELKAISASNFELNSVVGG